MPNYEAAKEVTRTTGVPVMFHDMGVTGVMRYHDGNWYWINVANVPRLQAKRHG